MKKLKNKIVGILLTAVMAIGGVMYSGGIVSAMNDYDISLFNHHDDLENMQQPGACPVDDDGNLLPNPKDCVDKSGTYYDGSKRQVCDTTGCYEVDKDYPIWITSDRYDLLSGVHETYYDRHYLSVEEAIDHIKNDHNGQDTSGQYKNLWTHYVVINYESKSGMIAYVRCDYFLGHYIEPGEDQFMVNFRTKIDNNLGIEDKLIDNISVKNGEFLAAEQVPTSNDLPEEYSGFRIDHWEFVNENGQYEEINPATVQITKETTFYAVIVKDIQNFTLTYHFNDGTNNTIKDTFDENFEVTLKDAMSVMEKDKTTIDGKDAIFVGWSKNQHPLILADGKSPADMVDVITMDSNKDVYAVWATDENGNEIPDYQEGSITVTKTIDQLTNIDGQGKPIFTFKLISENGEYVDYKTVTMIKNEAIVTFDGLPAGTYIITELEGIRYDLTGIDGDSEVKIATITIPEYDTNVNQKMSVTFHNTLTVKGNVSDTGSVTNTFTWNGTEADYIKTIDNN